MNILVLSPTNPWPANNGARIRISALIKKLAARHQIQLLAVATLGDRIAPPDLPADQIRCTYLRYRRHKVLNLVRWLFSNRAYRSMRVNGSDLQKSALDLLRTTRVDVIWCHLIETLECLPVDLGALIGYRPIIILDQHNSDTLWYESFSRSSSHFLRLFGRENIRRLKRIEPELYRRIDICFSVSDDDLRFSTTLNPNAHYHLVPNGVEIEEFVRHPGIELRKEQILFVGSLDVTMNQEAIRWFLKHVWERVVTARPNAAFCIVGRNPPNWIRDLDGKNNITVKANVADVKPYYQESRVVIAPFELGGGTKLKILEAFAAKVPIVTTSIGKQGISARHKEHLLVADNSDLFLRYVLDQLDQPDQRMVDQAHQFALEHFSWDKIAMDAEEAILAAL